MHGDPRKPTVGPLATPNKPQPTNQLLTPKQQPELDFSGLVDLERKGILSGHVEGTVRQRAQGMGSGVSQNAFDIVHFGREGQLGRVSSITRKELQEKGNDASSEDKVDTDLRNKGKPTISGPRPK